MEDEDEKLGCSKRQEPLGTSPVDAPRKDIVDQEVRIVGGGVVREGFQEEVGKGPQLLKGISYPLCTCLLLSTSENVPFSTCDGSS